MVTDSVGLDVGLKSFLCPFRKKVLALALVLKKIYILGFGLGLEKKVLGLASRHAQRSRMSTLYEQQELTIGYLRSILCARRQPLALRLPTTNNKRHHVTWRQATPLRLSWREEKYGSGRQMDVSAANCTRRLVNHKIMAWRNSEY